MNKQLLETTAKNVVERSILAADESSGTIQKRFNAIDLESTPEHNRIYRQMLFTAPGIQNYISGVIMYDETIRQSTDDDIPFPKLLSDNNIVPGIKVDQSTQPFPGQDIDTFTNGLESLDQRLAEYRSFGAGFAKWRAVITIQQPDYPTDMAIERNTHDLAAYALACQEHDIVPIVEPEVLMDGVHSFEEDMHITKQVLHQLFGAMEKAGVYIKGTILKPNMVTAGSDHADQKSGADVAKGTLEALEQTVPPELPGIAFLSGGQSAELATEHLNEINKIINSDKQQYPWRVTASYGRALQTEAIQAWAGKSENISYAQEVFIKRAKAVYNASKGNL